MVASKTERTIIVKTEVLRQLIVLELKILAFIETRGQRLNLSNEDQTTLINILADLLMAKKDGSSSRLLKKETLLAEIQQLGSTERLSRKVLRPFRAPRIHRWLQK